MTRLQVLYRTGRGRFIRKVYQADATKILDEMVRRSQGKNVVLVCGVPGRPLPWTLRLSEVRP